MLLIIFAVKLWITKNSEVPVNEQIVTQITIAVASGDLGVGDRVPSTGEIARRFDIHSNTVSAAYQRLVEQGVLEFRAGKGYFAAQPVEAPTPTLDVIVADVIRRAGELGYSTDDLIRALAGKGARRPRSILLIESDQGLRDIILYELRPRLNAAMQGISFEEFSERPVVEDVQLVAMSDEKPKVDPLLSNEHTCFYLKGRSVAEAMKGHPRPGEHEIVAVASGWNDFLTFARVMLLAAKIEPGNLIVRSTNDDNWQDALSKASLVICDPLAASQLDGMIGMRVFNIVSDDSITELAAAVDPSS